LALTEMSLLIQAFEALSDGATINPKFSLRDCQLLLARRVKTIATRVKSSRPVLDFHLYAVFQAFGADPHDGAEGPCK
jgi:hypothetical protein